MKPYDIEMPICRAALVAQLTNKTAIKEYYDARVYRVLERVGIKYISSAHIVIDACLTGSIEKEQALLMLDKLRISISDNVIEKAKDVILKWK